MDSNSEYKTWGRSRSNRLSGYDYSADRPVHVIMCVEEKKDVFSTEKHAKIVIDGLLSTADDLGVRILCYCLMPDHLHVVLSPGQSARSLSKFLNVFKGRTTTTFRKREGWHRIWQRSAFDHVIRSDENLRAVLEYIVNNPVRKGIAEKAEDYPYSKWFEMEIERHL